MSKELNEQELDKIAGGRRPSPCPKNKITPTEPGEPTDADFFADGIDVKVQWYDGVDLPADTCWASVELLNATHATIGSYVLLQSNRKYYKIVGSELKVHFNNADLVCHTPSHQDIEPTNEKVLIAL